MLVLVVGWGGGGERRGLGECLWVYDEACCDLYEWNMKRHTMNNTRLANIGLSSGDKRDWRD